MRRYYEFAVVVILLSMLGLLLINKLEKARDDMEEAAVQAEFQAMRAQLLEAVAHRETFGGVLPSSDNPADWLPTPLRDYRGALDAAPAEGSIWYFDRQEKVLVYRFRDGHRARFRLSRQAGASESRAVLAGVGLQRLEDKRE